MEKLTYKNEHQLCDDAVKMLLERHLSWSGSNESMPSRDLDNVRGQFLYAHIDAELARRWLAEAGATTLIHGHTHQPGDHALGADAAGRPLTQVVLSDWHVTAAERRLQVLRLTPADGLQRVTPRLG